MKSSHASPRRAFVRAATLGLVFMHCAASAFAVSTDLADVPLAVKNSAKPNIMFTLDNSGSMDWQEMPDAVYSYCNKRSYRSSSYNRVYYNPAVTYLPPLDAAGVPLTPPAWPNAYVNGFATTPTTRDVSTGFWADEGGCGGVGAANYCTYNAGASTILKSPTDNAIVNNDANFTCTSAAAFSAAEKANFVMWHSYYRNRIMAMKTALSRSFSAVNDQFRVGFYTINNNSGSKNTSGANFLDIQDFTTANKLAWYTKLFSVKPDGGTPLQEAARRVGEYFLTGALPGAASSTDPIQYSCQSNYHILSTDGYWNGSINVSVGNQDRTVPTLPVAVTLDPLAGVALTAGSNWPGPFYEGATATSDTLADVAMKYWVTDMRTSGTKATNNVPANSEDPATWQHLSTYTIGMGVDGSLPVTTATMTALKSGATSWPIPSASTLTAIDDLWHAAVNGHGLYFSASDPSSLESGLRALLDNIIGRSGAASAVAVANADVTVDNSSFASSYNSGNWSGDLGSYPINLTTGVPAATATWTAQALLDAATVTPSTRKIVSYTGVSGTGQGVQFQSSGATIGGAIATKLSTAQQNHLNSLTSPPGPSDGANVLAFLRGDRSLEGTSYRNRASRLGDIIDAEPVVVGTPSFRYNDAGYDAFKAAQSTTKTSPTRVKTIFQGANDGMMHAFRASDGAEDWAYIPNLLFDGPSKLRNLSKKTGFAHQYYVDATPIIGDVDFSNTCPDAGCPRPTTLPTASWKTLLIGGLGKGGRGYFALDVTTPTASSEIDAASKVLWEFPNSATTGTVDVTTTAGTTSAGLTINANKIGYTYGTPVIVKTKAHGWVALLTSGYNNGLDTGGDGHGYLFVLNARNGLLLHVFDTGVGDSTTPNGPSGLAHISAYVENGMVDNTVQYVYGGDMLGNVWRFDLNDAATANWKLKKLATLVDAATTPVAQSVTTAPELAKIVISGTERRFVYVGTGQYLGDSDIPGAVGANAHASQAQTMYGLVDDLSNPSGATAVISPLRTNLQQQTMTTSGSTRTTSSNTVNYSTKKGWYIDLPVTGERINTNPVLAIGALVFTSNIPNNDVCTPGGSSWLNILDYKTGGMTALNLASWSLGNVLASRPILIQLADGTIKVIIRKSDATTSSETGPLAGVRTTTRRASWREILQK